MLEESPTRCLPRNTRRARTALLGLALAVGGLRCFPVAAAANGPDPTTPYAFVDVTVIPMDRDRVLPARTVVVRGGRITAIGPAASIPVLEDASRIDGSGRWLMPGLAEMHAHVPPGNPPREGVEDLLFLWVANGITTIRGMLGAPYHLAREIGRGEVLGPRFLVGAPSLNGTTAPDPETAERLVREHHKAGFDFLRIHPGLSRATWIASPPPPANWA